jgi:hypothetical protein
MTITRKTLTGSGITLEAGTGYDRVVMRVSYEVLDGYTPFYAIKWHDWQGNYLSGIDVDTIKEARRKIRQYMREGGYRPIGVPA